MDVRAFTGLWLGAAVTLGAALFFPSNIVATNAPLDRRMVITPLDDQLINYCRFQARSTEAFAIARDEGVTQQTAKDEVEKEVERRNTNELLDDDVPIYVIAIIWRNIELVYEYPLLSSSQLWDRQYRRCVDSDRF